MGSSRPNCLRRLACTSGGTFGFSAISENGSPGASASTVNSTTLMPSRLGTAISRRRRRYGPTRRSSFGVPLGDRAERRIPSRERRDELTAEAVDRGPIDDRNDRVLAADEVVHRDQERGALDRIELG